VTREVRPFRRTKLVMALAVLAFVT